MRYHRFSIDIEEFDVYELLSLPLSRTAFYTRYECDEHTPDNIVQWCESADRKILSALSLFTSKPLRITNRKFLIYMPGGGGHKRHIDPIYVGDFGEMEPYAVLLYVSRFKGGELVYGEEKIAVKAHDLLLIPTMDKVPHEVLPSPDLRVVYRPTVEYTEEDVEVIQFTKSLYKRLFDGDPIIRRKLKRAVMEYLGRHEHPEVANDEERKYNQAIYEHQNGRSPLD